MNLEEVARRAKVSTATVSRVLNNASFVKNTTRTRVMKTIEELKYHPNLHARSLAGAKSRSIGVIVSTPGPSAGPSRSRATTGWARSVGATGANGSGNSTRS